MTKVYISSAMTGKPYFNHQAFFEKEAELRDYGYEVLNPAIIGQKHGFGKDYGFYLRKALIMLLDADIVLVFGDWKGSKGVAVERYVAGACGIPVFFSKEPLLNGVKRRLI